MFESIRRRGAPRFLLLGSVTFALYSGQLVTSQGRPGAGRTVIVNGHEALEGEVLVGFNRVLSQVERLQMEQQLDTETSELLAPNVRHLRSRAFDVHALLSYLRTRADVAYVEPNYILHALKNPNDPSFGSLWGLFNTGQTVNGDPGSAGKDIHAAAAWDVSTGSASNVVAVIDTGIDYTHPDLAANVWSAPTAFDVTIGGTLVHCNLGTHGFNAIAKTCDPMDDHYHGTHVSGTIGAVGNNGIGVAGVNWVASVMGVKFLDASGNGLVSNAINAIEFTIQAKQILGAGANVRVLSNSWSGGGFSQSLLNEINKANANDMLFVAAAANGGSNNDLVPAYPSSYTTPNIVAVAATDNDDLLASFSNYGATSVDLAAPGVNILSTTPNNTYSFLSGTSMATPHVSGAAALVLSRCALNTTALKTVLLNSVEIVGGLTGRVLTGGRLNADAAIRSCAAVPQPALTIDDVSVTEGNSGTTAASFTVTLTPASSQTVTVTYATADGTAIAGTDYIPASETLTFAPNTTTQSVAVAVTGDTVAEPNETFFVNLSGATNATLGDGQGLATVVNDDAAGSPVLTATPTAVSPGGQVTVGVSNGPANRADWVGLFVLGASDTSYTGWWYLNGLQTAPATGVTTASFPVAMPTTPGSYEFRFFANNGYTRLATGNTVTVQGQSSPVLTAAPTAVGPGGQVTVGVSNGPANRADWVGLFVLGASDTSYTGWWYLNGLQTAPETGVTTASFPVAMPTTPGSYEFRFFANNGYTRLATGNIVTVQGQSSPVLTAAPTAVAPGGQVTVGVSNGPANRADWVGLFVLGASDTSYMSWWYLNGLQTAPATGVPTASFPVAMPTIAGSYEFRFFANNGYTRLATGNIVTVQ